MQSISQAAHVVVEQGGTAETEQTKAGNFQEIGAASGDQQIEADDVGEDDLADERIVGLNLMSQDVNGKYKLCKERGMDGQSRKNDTSGVESLQKEVDEFQDGENDENGEIGGQDVEGYCKQKGQNKEGDIQLEQQDTKSCQEAHTCDETDDFECNSYASQAARSNPDPSIIKQDNANERAIFEGDVECRNGHCCPNGQGKSFDDLLDENGILQDVDGEIPTVVDLEELASENLQSYIGELEWEILFDMNKILESVDEEESSIDDDLESMVTAVENQCSEIKTVVDDAKKEMFANLFADKKKRSRKIKAMKEDILRQRTIVEELLTDCKYYLEIGGEAMKNFLNEKCPCIHAFVFDYNIMQSFFSPGIIDVPEIRREIGELDLGTKRTVPPLKATLVTYPYIARAGKDPEVLSTFDTNVVIGDIRISNSGEIWITNEESHCISKYSRNGAIEGFVNTMAYNENFVIDKAGNFLVCDYWDDQILKITPQGSVSSLITNLPSSPSGICVNHEEDIVVCMTNHHWIPIYSPDGQIKKREMSIKEPLCKESREMGQDKVDGDFECKDIFKVESPYRIIQNSRKDYIIVDGVWPYKIICLDVRGNFRWKYFIDQFNEDDSFQYNIVCTKTDDIIIADSESKAFNVINRDGQFVKYILFDDHGIVDPWSMAIDDEGRLLAGQDGDGKVHIIDLKL